MLSLRIISANQKGNVPLILMVGFLVIAGVGVGYYFGMQKNITVEPTASTIVQATSSPTVEPQEASAEVMVKVGDDPDEPPQSQNIDPNKRYEIQSLSFKVPHRWWSRYVKEQTNESYFLAPEQLCWNCGGNSVMSIHYMPNKSLVEQQEIMITGLYLKDVTKKNINISNRTGVLLEGRIETELDIPIPKGEIVHVFHMQMGQNLYEVYYGGNQYKAEFDSIISSLVIK